MTPPVSELERDVLLIPGISNAAVEAHHGAIPVVRVWLDGTREPADVATEIQAMLRQAGFRVAEPEPTPEPEAPVRRTGLGRGLEVLIPRATGEAAPKHLRSLAPDDDAGIAVELDSIAVIERATGVTLRAVDTMGHAVEVAAPPGEGDLSFSVAAAVSGVLGRPVPRLVDVDVTKLAGEEVVTVALDLSDGTKCAGATIVVGGMPFSVGRAVWAALHDHKV